MSFYPDNLTDWFAWQAKQHHCEIDLGLQRCQQVAQRLQLLKPDYCVILVGGTNGKGSSVNLLSHIYQQAGYRVAQYTSPHLFDYCERFQIQGQYLSEQSLCVAFEKISHAADDISLTRFEYDTLAALVCFAELDLDVVIFEVGLGGRLDSVNMLSADAMLITNVSLDHCDYLGDTREKIGFEKAGILRPQRPAVFADYQAPPDSLVNHAHALNAPLYCLGQDFDLQAQTGTDDSRRYHWSGNGQSFDNLSFAQGYSDYQRRNAAGVLAMVSLLQNLCPVQIGHIQLALQHTTLLPGRLQYLSRHPDCICDVGHNPAAAQALADHLQQQPCQGKTHALCAMLADKDMIGSCRVLQAQVDYWHIAPLNVPRAARIEQMQAALHRLGVGDTRVQIHDDVGKAYQQIKASLAIEDRLLVWGSFHTVAALTH